MEKQSKSQPQTTITYFRAGYDGVVGIAGDFNNWAAQNMTKIGQEGEYQINISLAPGRYQFCFFERPSDRALVDKT